MILAYGSAVSVAAVSSSGEQKGNWNWTCGKRHFIYAKFSPKF